MLERKSKKSISLILSVVMMLSVMLTINFTSLAADEPTKLVALTFDDGPDNLRTPLVLDKLDEYDVNATFMMVGNQVNDTTLALVERIVEAGHEIGNHSWDFTDMASPAMTPEQILQSVNDTTAAIEEYSGLTPMFFRAPNLSVNSTMLDTISLPFAGGITGNDWSSGTTAEQIATAILDSTELKDGAIILLHDNQSFQTAENHPTAEALDIIIPALIDEGFEFVTLSELTDAKGLELDHITLSNAAALGESIVNNGDFENGINWWYNRGDNTTIEVTSDENHSGTSSLYITNREAGWQGPAQDFIGNEKTAPELGKSYVGSAWVMFNDETAPDTMTFKLSVQWNDGTADHYDQVNQQDVTKGEWTKLEGNYAIASNVVTTSGIHLYVETSESAAPYINFYLDDVAFQKPISAPSLGGSDGLFSDFEDGTVNGWSARGNETVSFIEDVYDREGDYLLSVTDRVYGWNGAKHELTGGIINYDTTYSISGYVMYNEGPQTQDFKLTIQKTADGDTTYNTLSTTTVEKGEWTKLEGEYTVALDETLTSMILCVETSEGEGDLIDFYLDDVKLTGGDGLDYDYNLTSLRSVWDEYFPVGAAIQPEMLDNPSYVAYLKKHYKSLTAENCMKVESIQPTEGVFDFANADKIVDFAQANDMFVRAHALLWHSQIPDWFFTNPEDTEEPATSEQLLGRLKTHIDTFMTRYNGKIHTYDVVNEVFSDSDGLRGESENSKWKSIVGDLDEDGIDDDYIMKAFEYAYAKAQELEDEDVKFCINDYSLESNQKKLDAMYDTVVRILEKTNIPTDRLVVGFQMHINSYSPSIDTIKRSIEKFEDLGVKVQVTELDISIYKNDDEPQKSLTDDVLQLHAKKYKDLFSLFKEEAQKGIMDSVTIWGTDDGMTWLHTFPVTTGRTNAPLLFNERLQAKAAFTALTDPDSLPVYRQQLNAYKGTPVLGTEVDKLWSTFKPLSVSSFVYGTEGAIADLKTMWDNEYLYVLANVNDASVVDMDSVEVFLDIDSEAVEDNRNYKITSNNIVTGEVNSSTVIEGVYSSASTNANGYLVQVALPISGLELDEGSQIGFDLRVNDYNTNGDRISSVVWNDYKNRLDTDDTSGYSDLTLGKESKLISVKYGVPVVDGNSESVWGSVYNETNVWVTGTSGSTATFKTLWDEDYLYVLAEVTDSLITKKSADAYQQDSVEIFIDQNNEKTSYYEPDDYQIRINFDNELSYNPGELAGFKSETSITETGYIVEAAIPFKDVEATEGTVLGFDLQVNNDENDDGARDSVSMWCDPSGNTWRDVSGLGNIILDSATANPNPTPSPTKKPSSGGSSGGGGGGSSDTTPTPTPTTTPTVTPSTATTTIVPPVATPNFKDATNHWAKDAINDLVAKGIISGYGDGTVKPDNNITRAELAVSIIRALGIKPSGNATVDFADAKNIPSWALGYVALAKEKGIISGYEDKTFRPDRECTRQEAIVIIMKAFELGESEKQLSFADAGNIAQWSYKPISKATELDIIKGYTDNSFKPGNTIKRGELFTVLSKGLQKK